MPQKRGIIDMIFFGEARANIIFGIPKNHY
jgi:hypothetical protein